MMPILRAMFWWLVRFLSHARYRVRIVGGEKLRELRGPTLIMPNHPGYIDPPLLVAHLQRHGDVRPVVTESMYRKPLLYPMMRLANALEVPELGEHSQDARQQTIEMIESLVAGLERGDWFVLYPSGRSQRKGFEVLGANRAAAELLQRCPRCNVVLVRTRGVWGSMFTHAPTGKSPQLGSLFFKALGWLAASLFVFMPRRQVTMTVEVLDRRELPDLSRDKVNRFLEDWYNRDGRPETPTFVPYSFLFGPQTFEFPDLSTTDQIDLGKIRPATIAAVVGLLEEHLGRSLGDEEKQSETTLEQIGLDSLERMDVALAIEDRFGFRSDRVPETLGELWALADGQFSADADKPLPVPESWNRPSSVEPTHILAETLGEAFVRRALANPSDIAVADRVSGVLTYRRMLVAARLLGRRLGQLPGEAVGVLLPSSAAADIVFFALHMEGKLPVMLNWTTGPANLAHAVNTLGIQRVVTSRKLIDRLRIEPFGADYVFLEDLKGRIGKVEALATLLGTYLLPGRLIRRLPPVDPDRPAVVLFTSGSEAAPKAVPLTHRNLLTNCRASIAVLQPKRSDSMLAFLPPFHSFGLLGNVLAPVLVGLRVVHFPDPTDARGLMRMIAAYRTSLLITTPTFLGYIFAIATKEDLASLRILVTGAEKCPDAVFARAKELAPQATILEGYGITECSPVVAANRLDNRRQGWIGLPVNDVEVAVVDPDTHEPLPCGQVGMLLARGPSIFGGYLNHSGADPFVEVGGKRWYLTGDLVRQDTDGFIQFCGRLKRFLKAGGEMISLPALEERLAERYPPTEEGPQVAVEGIETPEGRRIALFTTLDIPLRQANAILSEVGFRGVMRLDEVIRLDAIPLLGTGKTDYKVLRKMLEEGSGFRVQGSG